MKVKHSSFESWSSFIKPTNLLKVIFQCVVRLGVLPAFLLHNVKVRSTPQLLRGTWPPGVVAGAAL